MIDTFYSGIDIKPPGEADIAPASMIDGSPAAASADTAHPDQSFRLTWQRRRRDVGTLAREQVRD
jgi:hypothetical protein